MLVHAKALYWSIVERTRPSRYDLIYRQLQAFTMVPDHVYTATLRLLQQFREVQGLVVECGTWKGGMIAGMRMLLGDDRQYLLLDSFEGLPSAKEIDGTSALAWQADTDSPNYYDNCRATQEDARKAMEISGASNYKIVKGWFEDTLPTLESDEGIAVLRLDGDWYESTMQCLTSLFPRVNQGGLILVDDYYTWDGCSRAVHDYLSKHQRTERIHEFMGSVCYLVKN